MDINEKNFKKSNFVETVECEPVVIPTHLSHHVNREKNVIPTHLSHHHAIFYYFYLHTILLLSLGNIM
jgi:hypothetical protein